MRFQRVVARIGGSAAVVAAALSADSRTGGALAATDHPVRARSGMVASAELPASEAGVAVLREGGSAVDAAVATAFALAVVHPRAGNIGGGGFLLYRAAGGEAVAYDFRETAPAASSPSMFLRAGEYESDLHHRSHLAVGVPGTVSGLHLAWSEHGRLPWRRLVEPAIRLAGDGFTVTDGMARDLREVLPEVAPYPASVAQFTKDGLPYEAGDVLRQPDLARTLERIAARGPAGFYTGETAERIEAEMRRGGGLITQADLAAYRAKRREPIGGTYRGYEVDFHEAEGGEQAQAAEVGVTRAGAAAGAGLLDFLRKAGRRLLQPLDRPRAPWLGTRWPDLPRSPGSPAEIHRPAGSPSGRSHGRGLAATGSS